MSVKIEIFGGDASEAMNELRAFSAPFHHNNMNKSINTLLEEELASTGTLPVRAPVDDEDAAPAAPPPERDADGLRWDERIHSSNHALNVDGTWRKKRGVADAIMRKVERELKLTMNETVEDVPAAIAKQTEPEPVPETDDTPEEQAQDAADEKAEADAARTEALTHDAVRGALGEYVKKYGMEAAQADGPKMLAAALAGDQNADNNGKPFKVSDIPDDQAALFRALAAVKEATVKNPFKRSTVA